MRNVVVSAGGLRFLQLFGWWSLQFGGLPVLLGGREQRLIAFLALNGRRMRSVIAGTLWPDSPEEHARSSLRVAILLIRRTCPGLLDTDQTTVALASDVRVDVQDLLACAAESSARPDDVDFEETMRILNGGELLPGWYQDWVVFERERVHHERLRALEALAVAELRRGRGDLALAAARAATSIEPLRESAHSIVIRANLMAGNTADAVGQYRTYAGLLEQELGISPSNQLSEIVRQLIFPTAGAR